ncbi:MAG: hypothetical protein CSA35_09355 [Dethiosulfovibrio peptidovorans]|nr:MAG: hypothetical protein CSA35_09355 [Dethiosulfovibrio peptidovorans]
MLGLTFMLSKDLALDVPAEERVSASVEFDDVTFSRGASSDLWVFEVRSVRCLGRTNKLKAVSGRRSAPDGSTWKLVSPGGSYDQSSDRLFLSLVSGTYEGENRFFSWRAPEIFWGDDSPDLWSFPKGIQVSGDGYSLVGQRGDGSPSRVRIEEGVMEWQGDVSSGR